MKQTPSDKLCELAKALSRNREALRENLTEYRELYRVAGKYINIKPARAEYLGKDSPRIKWSGWVYAVEAYIGKHEVSDECKGLMLTAARLLDEKKVITAQGARICNRIRIIGDQLLRAEQ